MSRLTIAIDVDDVLVDFNKVVLELVNEKYGRNRRLEDVAWNFNNLPDEERSYAHSLFTSSVVHARLQLSEGALRFVERCAGVMDIIFVTSVFPAAMPWRIVLLEQHFGHLDYSTVFTSRKDLVHTDIMIDDSVSHIINSSADVSILMRKPWNKSHNHECTVNDLEEAWKLIKKFL